MHARTERVRTRQRASREPLAIRWRGPLDPPSGELPRHVRVSDQGYDRIEIPAHRRAPCAALRGWTPRTPSSTGTPAPVQSGRDDVGAHDP